MTTDHLATVVDALWFVAPELDGTDIDVTADLQNDLGLDSMDSLNLVVAIKERTGVEIPDRELPRLRCVADIAEYLDSHGAT